MKKILVIGSLNMDMRIGLHKIPVVGETVLGNSLVYTPGGKGANQACAAGKLGRETVMLGSIGDDNAGRQLKESLEKSSVDTRFLRISKRNGTGTAVIYVDTEGNNSIVVYTGANNDCDVEYLKENDKLFRECEYIILQMEIPRDAVAYAVRRGRELSKVVILNPAPAPERMPEGIYPNVDYLTPNETELIKLAGFEEVTEENIRTGAHILTERGVRNVLVTLGDKGCCWFHDGKEEVVDAVKVRAIDTTAAGDCFNGAFAVALSEGMDVMQAIRFANIASSITVTREGAQEAIPDRKSVDQRTMDVAGG
ncbi:ribokinase [Lachnoclostridium sp. Marseille-P6806]|uniref:ribokinase n=1 Tax=Lachnoclostridium sp. Marseille-P6806 TaxID=2364793 RepID=UPI00102FE157|nr:ribokinase [Lachnoclostridium sp. Marseille-P6806]